MNEYSDEEPTCGCGNWPNFSAPSSWHPVSHPVAKEGPIKWSWFPWWSWLNFILFLFRVIAIVGVVLIIIGSFINGGVVVAGVILLIIGLIMVYITTVWKWNANKVDAYKIARGKRIQAVTLWEKVGSQIHYQKKDTLFDISYGGKMLHVLRDGTIEVGGTHRNASAAQTLRSIIAATETASKTTSVNGDVGDV